MDKNRMQAFSDGVFGTVAILLVIELKLPEGPSVWHSLLSIAPKVLAFVLSFLIITMYWIAHYSMFHFVSRVDRNLLWLNNLSLLCLSFIPFPTAVLGSHPFEPSAIALYGVNLMLVNLLNTLGWLYTAQRPELASKDLTPQLARQVALVHLAPVVAYAAAILMGTWRPWISLAIFAGVPLFFVIPNPWVLQGPRNTAK
jgi:uncharacterized membrane protein